jgi:hypothetical protein
MASQLLQFSVPDFSPSDLSPLKISRRTNSKQPSASPSPSRPVVPPQPDEPDELDLPPLDDAQWEVFVADDDLDPLPEPGDFWIEEPEAMTSIHAL